MKLCAFSAGFPVIELRSQVKYQTPREPTVFERMLLRVCLQYGRHPALANLSLQAIFERLGVSDVQDLLTPCVEDLVTLDVLRGTSAEDVLALPPSALGVTARGNEFLVRNRLPGRASTVLVHHLYDPLRGSVERLVPTRSPAGVTPSPEDAHIDAETFEGIAPEPLVRESLPRERHAWFTNSTEIETVASSVERTLWRSTRVVVDCDPAGVLRVSAPEDCEVHAWLQRADAALVWDRLLSVVLHADTDPTVGPALDLRQVRRVTLTSAPAGVAGECAVLRLFRKEAAPGATAPGRGSIDVVLDTGAEAPALAWDKDEQGLQMRVPAHWFPSGLAALILPKREASPMVWSEGIATVTWAGQGYPARLFVEHDEASSARLWADVQVVLDQILAAQTDPAAWAVAALWTSSEVVVARAIDRLAGADVLPMAAAAARLASSLKAFGLAGKRGAVAVWTAALEQALRDTAATCEGLSQVHLREVVGHLRTLPVSDRTTLETVLLGRAEPLQNLEQLEQLRRALDPKSPLPASLLPTGLQRALLERALASPDGALWGPHPFTAPLSEMRQAYHGLKRQLKQDPLAWRTEDDVLTSVRAVKSAALAQWDHWAKAAEGLKNVCAEAAVWRDSSFDRLDQQLQQWRAAVDRLLPPADLEGRRPVVIDTNVLIDYPDLPFQLNKRDVAVVPKRVLDELDHKKRDTGDQTEEVAERCRRAMRILGQLGRAVRYEEADLALLPADFGGSADNQILSVAVRLVRCRPLLLTSDKNLRLKATAQGVEWMDPKIYLNRSEVRGKRADDLTDA